MELNSESFERQTDARELAEKALCGASMGLGAMGSDGIEGPAAPEAVAEAGGARVVNLPRGGREADAGRRSPAPEERMREKMADLEGVNTALRRLLDLRDDERCEMEAQVFANYDLLVAPQLKRLRACFPGEELGRIVDTLEANLKEVIAPFGRKPGGPGATLSPAELRVSVLIKQGYTNKEIARILNNSVSTICRHRENIRGKLGLKNTPANLRTYLSQM